MPQTRQSPIQGVLLLAAAVFLFAAMNATTKTLSAVYAIPVIMAARYIIQTLMMVALLVPQRGWRVFATRRTGLVALRALALVASSLSLGLALKLMPVAETAALVFLAPMVVVLVARPLLKETIGLFGWLAVITGFLGVLFIVRPGSGLDPWGVLFAGLTVIGTVAYQIMSRSLSRTETTLGLLFSTAMMGSVVFGAMVPFSFGGAVLSPLNAALLVSLGITGGLGHYLLTAAYRRAPASLLAPVNYLELVWAGLLGWLVFSHLPDTLTAIGMAVVASSGVLVALRSAHMARRRVGEV
jgi:drug/metabolite transporter (DMT)-like permease